MAVRGSLFTLEEHKIFSVFKEGIPENSNKTQNIVDCRDDILYLWHASETCILTLNIKSLELDENVNLQRLFGTESTSFTVTSISVNPISTWVVVSGPRGISVLRLPRRSGPQALFQGGRDTVFCRSRILDEREYMCDCEVHRVRWHPNSSTDSHLLVLCSDNTLKLYDVASDDQPLKQVWRVGPKSGRLPLLAALGDAAVDIATGSDDRAFLLRGNGNIHLIHIGEDNNKVKMEGPLTMYPPADDNYGLESCSILMLSENFLCIATCGGTLYHCILLPDEDNTKETNINFTGNPISISTPKCYYNTQNNHSYQANIKKSNYLRNRNSTHPDSTSFSISDTQTTFNKELTHSLYVIEAIELDLGLTLNDDDPSYTCPIYLTADEGTKNRYFCHHETGVHIITVPIIDQLNKFFSKPDENINEYLPKFNISSTAEYVLCTKTSKMNSINPPLGICITYSSHVLLSILSDGRLVMKPLDVGGPEEMLFSDTLDSVRNDTSLLNKSNLAVSLNEMQKVPFNKQIHQLLKHELSQPLLKISSNAEPNPQECFELLTHATHVFREDYFSKIERARKELEKKSKTLKLLKNLQIQEIEDWLNSNELINEETIRLREKCKNAQNIQKALNDRCKNVLRALRKKQSAPSAAEKEMSNQLDEYAQKMPKLQEEFAKIQQKITLQKTRVENWNMNRKKEEIFLGKHLTEIIKNTLGQQTSQIKDLVQKVNSIKSEVGLE